MAANAGGSRTSPGGAFDVVLVGGGLQNGLIALSLRAWRPEVRIAVVERGPRLGGNHTWCMHEQDVPERVQPVVEPLLVHRFEGYDVRFPGRARRLASRYAAITSERFHDVVSQALRAGAGSRVYLGCVADVVDATGVRLGDGRVLTAPLVVDARGPDLPASAGGCGYQKFLGLELTLARPHRLSVPVLMDATVPQTDGFRFMYVLPFGPRRLLVEDTVFSCSPGLDAARSRAAVLNYARVHYGEVADELRQERGVLPMPWTSRWPRPAGSPLSAGMRGGFLHPATGYSFPPAMRLAYHIATQGPACAFGPAMARLWRQHRAQGRFAERLNWMLFHCFDPQQMWHVFARFYGLPAPLIQRFYAMKLTAGDRARILVGRPPRGLSLWRALAPQGQR